MNKIKILKILIVIVGITIMGLGGYFNQREIVFFGLVGTITGGIL